jgi:hypothetical protein
LVSCGVFDNVRWWPLAAGGPNGGIVPALASDTCAFLDLSASGSRVLRAHVDAEIDDLDGGPGRLVFRSAGHEYVTAAFDRSEARVAIAPWYSLPDTRKRLRLIELSSGRETASLPLTPAGEQEPGGIYDWGLNDMEFLDDNVLLASGPGGLRRFDFSSGRAEWLWRTDRRTSVAFGVSRDGTRLVAAGFPGDQGEAPWQPPVRIDVTTGARTVLTGFGHEVRVLALDASGTVLATGDNVGVVRVGRIDGGEPHLLLGHSHAVSALALSRDQRWIASASGPEIRLWPMPDLSRPPLHTLPLDQLLAKLRSLTNLRVVDDPGSPNGYKVDVGPFPGWREVPTW